MEGLGQLYKKHYRTADDSRNGRIKQRLEKLFAETFAQGKHSFTLTMTDEDVEPTLEILCSTPGVTCEVPPYRHPNPKVHKNEHVVTYDPENRSMDM